MDYFYSAAKHRSRGALWPIFAPALIPRGDRGEKKRIGEQAAASPGAACEKLYTEREPRLDTGLIVMIQQQIAILASDNLWASQFLRP